MSRILTSLSRHLGDAVFAVLPSIPYAQKEKGGCPGIAVSAKQLSAAARLDGPVAFHDATFEQEMSSATKEPQMINPITEETRARSVQL